jgi:hypothetical protein
MCCRSAVRSTAEVILTLCAMLYLSSVAGNCEGWMRYAFLFQKRQCCNTYKSVRLAPDASRLTKGTSK